MPVNIVTDAAIARLQELFESVEIRCSVTQDGSFTASTSKEPLFCFTRRTKDELAQVVIETFVSYVTNFVERGDEEVTIDIEVVNLGESLATPAPPPIPIHALRPYSRAKPVVRRGHSQLLQAASAEDGSSR